MARIQSQESTLINFNRGSIKNNTTNQDGFPELVYDENYEYEVDENGQRKKYPN